METSSISVNDIGLSLGTLIHLKYQPNNLLQKATQLNFKKILSDGSPLARTFGNKSLSKQSQRDEIDYQNTSQLKPRYE